MDRGIFLGSGGKVRATGTLFEPPAVVGADNTHLPLQDTPTVNRDWSNPVLRWSSVVAACLSIAGCAGPPNLLTSTLNAAVTHPPFVLSDQPNPVLRVRTVQPEIPSNKVPLTSVTRWRAAVISKFEPRKVQQPEYIPNLLANTLGFFASPFYQTDQPNPVLRTRTVQPEIPPNLTNSLKPPFAQADWPNVVLRVPPDRSQIPPDLLTSTLNQAANQTPFQHPDQPNPVLRIPPDRSQIPPDLLTSTLNQAVNQTPFQVPDQVNPVLRMRTVQPEPPPNLLGNTLGFVASPFYQTEQPNPLPKPRTVQPEIPPNLTFNLKPPFYQLDWPNAVPRVRTVQPENPPNRAGSNLPPFKQISWTNPVLARQVQQPPQLSDYFAFTPNPIPFSLDNQPNPVLRTRTVQPENPQNLVPVQTTTPVTYAQRGVLCTRIPPKHQAKTDIPPNLLPAIYFFSGPQPFNQKVWPVHRRRFDWLSQTFDTTRYDTELYPFYQTNWPNPIQRVFKGYLQDFTNRTTLVGEQVTQRRPLTTAVPRVRTVQPEIPINIRPLTGPPVIPAKQNTWPNPAPKPRTVQPENPINIALLKTAPIPPFFLRNQPNPTLSVSRFGYWVFQFDRLNLSLQPAVWGAINDAQTPGWNATGDPCTVDSTIGTADTTLYTADMDCSATWGTIDDSETPGWTPIVDSQTPAWSVVDDSETPGWTPVITDPGGSSSS